MASSTRALRRQLRAARGAPGRRELVEAVVHDRHLALREPHAFDVESCERIGDADHARGSPRAEPLDVAERPEAEGIVVVLRRNNGCPSGCDSPVDVGVDEMGVDDIWLRRSQAPPEAESQCGIEVVASPKAEIGNLQLVELGVERIRIGVVEPDERRLDAHPTEGRKKNEQMSLRPTDPAKAMNVDDLHEVASLPERPPMVPATRDSVIAAGTHRRKSHGAR